MKQGLRVTGHITNRDLGRIDFAGTVTDTYRSGRDTLITVACDDGIERTARQENVTAIEAPAEPNLQTHTGKVHAPGAYYKQIKSRAPKCCASASAVARFHYIVPTDEPVDCHRCLAALAN
ncbi:hypothetical protein ACFYPN_16105 [Streptomyces sp. NPDC005576]|uniref:hypothetical protein n=1 Tax=Streptomyces sp. NPDC005576 TaxID=3364726 RepID=UPI0036A15F93